MVDIVAPNKGKQLNQTPSPLKAFKREESLELSKWYMGTLMTNLAETSPRICLLTLVTAAGLEEVFRDRSTPAEKLEAPSGALTYSQADLKQTV
jgi:hypothetical protein